jgi:solute carrier family 25 citrate transporter 1
VAVTLKQSSNAVVRFTSYNFLLDQTRLLLGERRRAVSSVIAGAGAGLITVYCTMPMDNIKTRLQAIGGMERYSGSWDCLKTMVREESVSSLWKGTSPRLVRLTVSVIRANARVIVADSQQVSGAISFAIYEQVLVWTSKIPRLDMMKEIPAHS